MLHVSTLITPKDFLVLCYLYLWGIALGSMMLVLKLKHDLVT
jgi:hypothetical protein